jgi:hypothetical protein
MFQLAIQILPCTILFPATTPRIVTPLKRPSTALQPTLIQLTPRRQPSTTPRRHRHDISILQFSSLQPTLL